MSENKSSYRQIVKSTSIFGGVQIVQVIIGIIRSKFIAVFLGPVGIGISGLLTATIGLIAACTNFGLSTSAVKDISAAYGSNNNERLALVKTVFKRLVWLTGLLGTFLTAVLSPWLSDLTFGNRDYTLAFIWISITLLLNQLSGSNSVLLQGTRQIKYMAQASINGSIIGLFTTLPLYYFLGTKGIVPGIIVTALTSLLLTWYYSSKLEVHNISVSKKKTIAEGKGMLKLGFMISISGLITLAASYFVRIFIRNHGGVDQVGLYNAGFAIINTYVGMIFTAMSTDYFPRLSAVHKNNKESGLLINQQAEMALLILAPILMIFFVFSNLVVIVLYSKQFLPVTSMLYWAALGMFFKAGSWSISFIFLAKGDSKFYFWNELITNIYIFCFNILGYYYYGLTGLGLSFLISYFIYFVQVYLIAKIKYEFKFNSGFFKIFTIQFILGLLTITVVFSLSEFSSYFVGSILIAISLCFSIMELDKRIELKNIVSSFIKKIKKR